MFLKFYLAGGKWYMVERALKFHADMPGFPGGGISSWFPPRSPSSRLPLRLFACPPFVPFPSVASIVRAIFTVQRRRTATRWSAKFLDKLRQLSSKRGRPRPRSRPQLKRDIKSSFASSAVKKNITRKLASLRSFERWIVI